MALQEGALEEIPRPSRATVEKYRLDFEQKQQRNLKIRKEMGLEFKEDILKIHINAGKKTKMRAGDVVGALCNIEGVTGADIGVIHLMDVSTFVEILNGKGELALRALQTMPIKGRKRKVSRSNETEYERDLRNGY